MTRAKPGGSLAFYLEVVLTTCWAHNILADAGEGNVERALHIVGCHRTCLNTLLKHRPPPPRDYHSLWTKLCELRYEVRGHGADEL